MGKTLTHRSRRGLTLIEIAISLVVISILASVGLPAARMAARRAREFELRYALRHIREGIDKYYELKHKESPEAPEDEKYPSTLDELVEERILRRIPVDPMTGKTDWMTVSTSDDRDDFIVMFSDNANVYDVFSKSEGISIQGTPYKQW